MPISPFGLNDFVIILSSTDTFLFILDLILSVSLKTKFFLLDFTIGLFSAMAKHDISIIFLIRTFGV